MSEEHKDLGDKAEEAFDNAKNKDDSEADRNNDQENSIVLCTEALNKARSAKSSRLQAKR